MTPINVSLTINTQDITDYATQNSHNINDISIPSDIVLGATVIEAEGNSGSGSGITSFDIFLENFGANPFQQELIFSASPSTEVFFSSFNVVNAQNLTLKSQTLTNNNATLSVLIEGNYKPGTTCNMQFSLSLYILTSITIFLIPTDVKIPITIDPVLRAKQGAE